MLTYCAILWFTRAKVQIFSELLCDYGVKYAKSGRGCMIFILARLGLVSYIMLYLYYILSLLTLPLTKLPQRLYVYAIIAEILFHYLCLASERMSG